MSPASRTVKVQVREKEQILNDLQNTVCLITVKAYVQPLIESSADLVFKFCILLVHHIKIHKRW